MYIRGYVDAFQQLLEATNGADHLEALKLYGIAAALFQDMQNTIEVQYQGRERPPTYPHTIEKLGAFMDTFSRAVMRHSAEQKSQIELLNQAQGYLTADTVS